MTKRNRLAAWAGLGLLAGGPAVLSLSSEPVRAAAPSCPAPTAAKCLEEGYLDSPCAAQHAAICKPAVQDALAEHHKASRARKRPMLRVGGAELPTDLKTGRFYPYKGPKRKASKNPKFTLLSPHAKKAVKHPGNNAMASQRYGGPAVPKGGPKLDRHRNPKWAANGKRVESCDEFAYESLHDWSRFVDVAQTCRGDADCITEVGLGTTAPGLDHTMRDTQGRKIDGHNLSKHALPKNDFFKFSDKFAFAGGPDGFAPKNPKKWMTMAAHLRHGHNFHRIGLKPLKKKKASGGAAVSIPVLVGPAGKTKYYSDEFSFHRKMRKRTAKLSENERAEFARRRKLLNELTALWVANSGRVKAAMKEAASKHNIQPEVQIPFLTNPADPFVHLAGAIKQHKQLNKLSRKAMRKLGPKKLGNMPGAGVVNKLVPRNAGQVGLRTLEEIDADLEAVGMFAAPSRGKKKAGKPTRKQRRQRRKAERLRRGKRSKRPGSKKKGTPKSGLTAGLTTAQAKKLQPAQFQGSHVPEMAAMKECLAWPVGGPLGAKASLAEMGGYGPISCRIGALLRFEWERKLAGQASCINLEDPSCDWSPEMFTERFAENLPYLEDFATIRNDCNDWTANKFKRSDTSLVAVEDRIKEVKALAEEALGELEPYMLGKAGEHGQAFGFDWGDTETWGDKDLFAAGYSAGLGWEVTPTNSSNGEVCALEGHAEASFDVSGYFFGKEAKVVDALGRVEAKNGDGELDAHVVALGYHLFDEKKNFNLTKAWEADKGKSINVPDPKPSVTIPAGPIIITGSAWGELYFGAEMRASAKANQCSGGSLFHAEASIGPTARLTAAAQVGFGVSGFVSAGVRGYLDLITLGLPLGLEAKTSAGNLVIGGGLDMLLGTLSGRLALYVEYLIGESEYDIIKWAGLGPEEFELFKLPTVSLPLVAM